MKTTNNPTAYILLRAGTNSLWDNCEFALIHISEDWKQEQRTRLETIKLLEGNEQFHSLTYYESAVDFYGTADTDEFNLDVLLEEKEWVFVELGKADPEIFKTPENRLISFRLIFFKGGTARFKAYGKHTGEEFWTTEFSLEQILESL